MTNLPDLDRLLERIRAEAQEFDELLPLPEPLLPLKAKQPGSRDPHLGSPASPAMIEHINDLLAIGDDARFLHQAYLRLLCRPADPAGYEHYIGVVKRYGRPFALCALRLSPEGRDRNVHLPGFGLAPRLYQVWGLLQRRGLGRLVRLPSLLYHRWRRLQLGFDTRLLYRFDSAQNHLSQEIDQVATSLDANIEKLTSDLSASNARIDQLGSQLTASHTSIEQLASDRNASNARIDQLANALTASNARTEQLANDLTASNAGIDQLNSDLAASNASIEQLASDLNASNARIDQLNNHSQASSAQTAVLQTRVKMLQLLTQPIGSPLDTQHNIGEQQREPASPTAVAERVDAFYLAFEEHLRGSQQEVSDLLSDYLVDLGSLPDCLLRLPVLDIGSGRGEWLKLLVDFGFAAEGVEINPLMAGTARAGGFQVHCADALDYLCSLPDDSRAAISAFHVAEHLPFATLFALLEQAWRVLAPGGLLILETPNPENLLVGAHTFWHDFSHQRPITPAAFEFLVRFHGFSAVRLRRLHPYPPEARIINDTPLAERVSGHLYGPQDYTVLANKPALHTAALDLPESNAA